LPEGISLDIEIENGILNLKEKDIEDIVTHEQYDSIKYIVKGE
jgi:hypothetical protein